MAPLVASPGRILRRARIYAAAKPSDSPITRWVSVTQPITRSAIRMPSPSSRELATITDIEQREELRPDKGEAKSARRVPRLRKLRTEARKKAPTRARAPNLPKLKFPQDLAPPTPRPPATVPAEASTADRTSPAT